jgi:hypothetical protein
MGLQERVRGFRDVRRGTHTWAGMMRGQLRLYIAFFDGSAFRTDDYGATELWVMEYGFGGANWLRERLE